MLRPRQIIRYAVFVAVIGTAVPLFASQSNTVAFWKFDGDLQDCSGRGNDAFAERAFFADGHSGQGLRCGSSSVVVPDRADLRLAAGLRVECWAKFEQIGASWQPLLIKDGAYQLRLDPPGEGGHFSFFVHLDGWEPRVRSNTVAKVGEWYHLAAGWDGQRAWIEVNGGRTAGARTGEVRSSHEPLELGQFDGVLDEVRIENPNAQFAGVAQWPFDGSLRDASQHGHDLAGTGVSFVPVASGQALNLSSRRVQTASRPELQLAPGLRIDCSVYFRQVPVSSCQIVSKSGEYQLRVNPASEGGGFAFLVNLDGWEPRVDLDERVIAGRWYRLSVRWDGFALTLDVNGRRTRVTRSGLVRPSDAPLVVGDFDGWIDNLVIENPRLPTLQVREIRQEHAILCCHRPERLTASIRNVGMATQQAAVRLEPPPGARVIGPAVHKLGAMPMGAEQEVEWLVQAETPIISAAGVQATATGSPPVNVRHPLVFFQNEDGMPTSSLAGPAESHDEQGRVTFFVDGIDGDNSRDGTAPAAAWKDFSPINGRALGPGERLLIRRGSVVNQELTVSARGTAQRWVEIGAYGHGPRPIIRRNWDIGDRCVLVRDPDFLRIRSLVVCHAAKGLVVTYSQAGHRGLVVEDCIGHHIEGLYRPNAHGIPEWRDREGPAGDGLSVSAAIAITGAPATGLVIRNCESFQCSSGFFVRGDDVLVDRYFCHDNFVHNTSPHPFLVAIRRAVLQNSIFDASGWHASAGTMGIMLGNPQGLIIRNCYFQNQPDSGSHDEGGIDFENSGNGTLIDHCTFENNAGAAIEVLGLRAPQTTNIEIRKSRFIRNNTAGKLGPAEIFVWGRTPDPTVCCSTGTVHDNGYVLLSDVKFFINEADKLTDWVLRDNEQFSTSEDLEESMPFNRPPLVDAGPDVWCDQQKVALAGRVTDDQKPGGRSLSLAWEVLEGPGAVVLDDARAASTSATFAVPGNYSLRLAADDGELWRSDLMEVHVLPGGTTSVVAWDFNRPLDKEGWTDANLGTRVQQWPNPVWPTTSHPLKYVAGGYYVVAIEDSADAQLLSPDHVNVDLTDHDTLTIRLQNHTPTTHMQVRFTTVSDPNWDDVNRQTLDVVANDNVCRVYSMDMSVLPAWRGRLKQLRLDLATGQRITGTCRIDYIGITRQSDLDDRAALRRQSMTIEEQCQRRMAAKPLWYPFQEDAS